MCFEPFVGVGPRNFFNLFSVGLGKGVPIERKQDGNVLKWDEKNAILRIQMLPHSYIDRETKVADQFGEIIQKQGLRENDKKTC